MTNPVRAALVAAVFVVPFAAPGPAAASCAATTGPPSGASVFVATMQEERRGYSRLEVEEVWSGPDLAPEVWVLSGQHQPPWPLSLLQSVASSNDADLADGHRYVVAASRGFATGACSVEEVAGKAADAAGRPAAVRRPVADGAEGADPPVGPVTQAVAVSALAGGLLAVVVLRRSRAGRRTRSQDDDAARHPAP